MSGERILIVEDEGIVATDLESTLQKLGYDVVGIAATGQEAITLAENSAPDLVLMDIRLKGNIDGIEAAEQITASLNVPITFLTAYADEATVERAKTTMPYGYILKPFQEGDIRSAAEVALYKHKMESMLASIQNWHAETLRCMSEAVVAMDKSGRITFLNEMAEKSLDLKLRDVYGKPLEEWMSFPFTAERMLKHDAPYRADRPANVTLKSGRQIHIQYSFSVVKDGRGDRSGILLIFHEALKEKNGPGQRPESSVGPSRN
jgi:CheY-like chemotaxis protein